MEFINQLGLIALGSRLKALSDQLYALADEAYAAAGLRLQGRWFPVLRLVQAQGSASIGEIAQSIGQTHSAVSQLASKLVRDGWLVADTDVQDRRQRRLRLSSQAMTQLRLAKVVWRAIENALSTRFASVNLDVLNTMSGLEQVLATPLIDDIAQRVQAIRSGAVKLVPYRPELQPEFYRLNEAWLRKYFYLEEIDHFVLSNPEQAILKGGGSILFASLDDEWVGTCALKHEGGGVYELTKMGVDERCQGLGVGRRLIEAAIDEFKRRGGKQLFLETNSKLEPAIRLYESVGFEHQATRKPDSHYQRSDVYMIWRKPPAGRKASATSR